MIRQYLPTPRIYNFSTPYLNYTSMYSQKWQSYRPHLAQETATCAPQPF